MNDLIGVGIIGAGARIRTVLSSVMNRSGGRVKIVAVFDPDPVSIANTFAVFGDDIRVHPTEESLANDPEVSWVFVGSVNSMHARHAIEALEAGKNVFCEKPLATELTDCLAVRDVVRRTGLKFVFGLVLRYSPHYQKVHEIVQSGVIGDIVSFEFNETLHFEHGAYIFGNWRRSRAFAGTHLLEKCCHDLDLASWLVQSRPVQVASFGGQGFFKPANGDYVRGLGTNGDGKPAYRAWTDHQSVDPFSGDADIVDHQVAIIEYASGVRATFHTNCNSSITERRFYICGTRGTLRADALQGTIELRKIGYESQLEVIETGASDNHAGGDDVMAQGIIDTMFHDALPLATLDDGINAFVAALGIDLAMDEGRVVDLTSLWSEVEVARGVESVDVSLTPSMA